MNARRLIIATSMALVCTPALAEGDAEAGKSTFEETCEQCHYADDFDDEAKSVLEAMLLAIMNGEIRHRGGFSGLSEEDLANLAAFLSGQ